MSPASVQKHPRYSTNAPVLLVDQSKTIQTLLLANISSGGMFVCTRTPLARDARVQVRMTTAEDVVVDTVVRVVHVADVARTGGPEGMGLEIERIAPSGQTNLDRYIELLARETQQRARTGMKLRQDPRFISHTNVKVRIADQQELEGFVASNVSHGGLFVETPTPPPLRTRVDVEIETPKGRVTLNAEVVHAVDHAMRQVTGQPMGAGLQFLALSPVHEAALQALLTGQVLESAAAVPGTPGVAEVMDAVRVLLAGVEKQDGFAALGLSPAAQHQEVEERVRHLRTLFSAPPSDATPPQQARIVTAARTLVRVERSLTLLLQQQRIAQRGVIRLVEDRVRARVTPETPPTPVPDGLAALLTAVGKHLARKELVEAHATLLMAQVLAPGNSVVEQSLKSVSAKIDTETALELLHSALLCAESGMRPEAASRVKEAMRLSSEPDMLASSLKVLVKIGSAQEAVRLAKRLLQSNPRNERAWEGLLDAYEASGQFDRALYAADRLKTLRPKDAALLRRIQELIDRL